MGTATHAFFLDVDRDYLGKENCPEILVRSRPELIPSVHASFYAVGSACGETDSLGRMPPVFAEIERAHQAYALNKTAAEPARPAAHKLISDDLLLTDLRAPIRTLPEGPHRALYLLTDSGKGRLLKLPP